MRGTLALVLLLSACAAQVHSQETKGAQAPFVVFNEASPDAPLACEAVLSSLKGLTTAAAGKKLTAQNLLFRIESQDGVAQVLTMDFRTDRVNLTVVKGKVSSARCG